MDILQGVPEGSKAEQMQLFNYLCLGRTAFFLGQGISAAFSPSRYSLYYLLHLRLKKPIGAASCPPCTEDLFPEKDKLAWSGSFTPPETTSPCGVGQWGHRVWLCCPGTKVLPLSAFGITPSQICCIKKLPGGSFPVELMDFKGSCGQGNATPVKHKVKFLFK